MLNKNSITSKWKLKQGTETLTLEELTAIQGDIIPGYIRYVKEFDKKDRDIHLLKFKKYMAIQKANSSLHYLTPYVCETLWEIIYDHHQYSIEDKQFSFIKAIDEKELIKSMQFYLLQEETLKKNRQSSLL